MNDKNKENKKLFSEVSTLCEKAVQDGTFPGCVVSVYRRGQELFRKAFGVKSLLHPKDDAANAMEISTVFDIATLTNIFVTTTILMRLVQNGRINLDDRVSRYIQEFAVNGKAPVTIRHLLNHTSGLMGWVPFYEELLRLHEGERRGILISSGAKQYVFNHINRTQLKYETATKQLYSDVGYLLLGYLIEIVTGAKLDRAAHQYVFQPLGLKSSSFIDLAEVKRRGFQLVENLVAPTENCEWRQRVLCGEVFDDNAWVMGGVAGNSGVFVNQWDLHLFAFKMLQSFSGQSDFVQQRVIREFWNKVDVPNADGWVCGWEKPSKENLLLDTKFSEHAVGINGSTGCSLWLEPEQGLEIILMSNAVHPVRTNKKIRNFRPVLFDSILSAVEKI